MNKKVPDKSKSKPVKPTPHKETEKNKIRQIFRFKTFVMFDMAIIFKDMEGEVRKVFEKLETDKPKKR